MSTALLKRARVDDEHDDRAQAMTVTSSGDGRKKSALIRTVQRTSALEAPIVSLAGAHQVSEVQG
jgi:Prp8 binding protein